MNIRFAKQNDIYFVAKLHVKVFPKSFLTMLGFPFLYILYNFFYCTNNIFFVSENKYKKINGFAVGALSSQNSFVAQKALFFPLFALSCLPIIFSKPFFFCAKIVKRIFCCNVTQPFSSQLAILKSLGVSVQVRGKGIAQRILTKFEKYACSQDCSKVILTTDQYKNERALRFYQRRKYKIIKYFLQDGSRPMVLMCKSLTKVKH